MLFESNTSLPSISALDDTTNDQFLKFYPSTGFIKNSFEIDVKPRKKEFASQEEKNKFVETYNRKLKTEMCKNWELKGSCKYSSNCAFAHGKEELKEKKHLNSNFKTKPCKQFFKHGYCSYGYRCQYLHSELKQHSNYQLFLLKIYYQNGISLNCLKGGNYDKEEEALKMIEDMTKIFNFKGNNFEEIFDLIPHKKKRLEIFQSFSEIRQN